MQHTAPNPSRPQRPRSLWRSVKSSAWRALRFVQQDMWRLLPEEISPLLHPVVSVSKVVYRTTVSFIDDHQVDKAASLTYSTVLSIVPMLAIIVGIAKGFGIQTIVAEALTSALPGQAEQISVVFRYVENYLSQVQGGLFIGLGLIILFYTVLMLISSIEDAFNSIWQAPHPRSWTRRIFDYFGLFLLLPIVLLCSSAITIAMTTIRTSSLSEVPAFASLLDGAMGLVPLVLSVGLFVLIYMYLPNVRVRFLPALIAGVLAGVAFQIFQTLYINGVLWISRYNAIYGSFAAFPLLLLWLQLSWSITLYGAQLSYTIQNIQSFAFGQATMRVSRRYLDFVCLIIISRITRRFAQQRETPYDATSLSNECRIPLRMTVDALYRLEQVGLVVEIHYGDDATAYYQPAVDTSLLSVGYVVALLDRYGTEDFRIDRHDRYHSHWQAMLTTRGTTTGEITPETLVKDL